MAGGKIGLGVIGVNATNMGSTVSLLQAVPDLRYELRAIGAGRAERLAALARDGHDMRPVYQVTPWRVEGRQELMYGGIVHVADILRSFCGDVAEVHAFANHGTLTPEYPLQDNYLLNMRFESGVIGQGVG